MPTLPPPKNVRPISAPRMSEAERARRHKIAEDTFLDFVKSPLIVKKQAMLDSSHPHHAWAKEQWKKLEQAAADLRAPGDVTFSELMHMVDEVNEARLGERLAAKPEDNGR